MSNCQNCCCNSVTPYYVYCYCSRYVDVPMKVYVGSGYTELDCCVDTRDALREISDNLNKFTACFRYCNCGRQYGYGNCCGR